MKHTSIMLLLMQIIGSSLLMPNTLAQSDGGDISNPDMKIEGYTYFGTNVTGATSVTSGWGNVYIENSLEIASNLVVNGSVLSPDTASGKKTINIAAVQLITAGGGINPTNTYLQVSGSGGDVDITKNPQIDAAQSGQQLILQGTSDSQRVKIEDGSGVQTKHDRPFHLGQFDTMMFIFDGSTTNWVEIYRSDN